MQRFSWAPHSSSPVTGNLLHLPNGINVIVTPVFGGFYFKVHELNTHQGGMPPGWTIIIHSEDQDDGKTGPEDEEEEYSAYLSSKIHKYRVPTLRNDVLFISSISNPSSNDFRPALSPSREIAMMLWATLWWYFHQPQPAPKLSPDADATTDEGQRAKLDWRIQIKKDGIFKGRHLLSKMERMGLIACEDSSVGVEPDDRRGSRDCQMFVSQRSFWQTDARIFLFTLSPVGSSPYPSSSPFPSRPASPNRTATGGSDVGGNGASGLGASGLGGSGLPSPRQPPDEANPFHSSSHLPTFYPQPPTQFVTKDGVRHPLRPRPPRQGETFYTRYIPSTGQYLSFRCASMSKKSVTYRGPYGQTTPSFLPPGSAIALNAAVNSLNLSTGAANAPVLAASDVELLHAWLNKPRVATTAVPAYGDFAGPKAKQEGFLKHHLASSHSYPAIGCWDGRPFGFFEFFWAKEDELGRHANIDEVGNYDRGFRVFVGEDEFRGPDRVRVWMSALVHHCWLAEPRTESVLVGPSADNTRLIKYFEEAGFRRQHELEFERGNKVLLMKITRDSWEAPRL